MKWDRELEYKDENGKELTLKDKVKGTYKILEIEV